MKQKGSKTLILMEEMHTCNILYRMYDQSFTDVEQNIFELLQILANFKIHSSDA